MKTKFTLSILLIIFCGLAKSQVLISMNQTTTTPHPSAVLQVADDKRGVLLPQVALLNNTDQVTAPTPVPGLTVFNTTTKKFNFWEDGVWNRTFAIDDGLAIIKQTENFSGNSTSSKTSNTFANTMPMFTLDEVPATNNWLDLGASTTLTITKASNTNYIITEGMVQINNTANGATNQQFQFAIGVFVDGKLKLANKYYYTGGEFICDWKKFNLSGVFNDLSIGTHTVQIYGRNLPKVGTGYTQITYGGNTTGCSNITNDMARIFVTAQVTQ